MNLWYIYNDYFLNKSKNIIKLGVCDMIKITIIGTGYVGLVNGACLSDFGIDVICVDNDKNKIDVLNQNIVPFYEPSLEDLIIRNRFYKRLEFTTDIKYAIESANVIFVAVGTPLGDDGNIDLNYVYSVARDIAAYINSYKIIVMKSTVPVGTCRKIKEYISDILQKKCCSTGFDIVSNPEFLREGKAIYDFTHPDKVVIGTESENATEMMKKVYRVLFLNETPFIFTNIETAEMIKYANNVFLAMKISFINEIANLCETTGADVQVVSKAIGKDGRIGSKFLHAGPGFGGSCLPKDTLGLLHIGKSNNLDLKLIKSIIEVNNLQKYKMVEKVEHALHTIKGKKIAVLGLTFKPMTDDMRDAPAITIINELHEKGASFKVFDPEGMKEAKKMLNKLNIEFCKDEYEAIDDCDALIIITEWHQFRNLNLEKVKKLLKTPYFFDLRNIYDKIEMQKLGFQYYGVGV